MDYRTVNNPEAWVKIFRDTEAGWMEFNGRWYTPPYLMSAVFTGIDAGSASIESQQGLLFMLAAHHVGKFRRSVVLAHIKESEWEDLEPLYLEIMMTLNLPFFRDHITCGTSMRHPFPDFNQNKPIEFTHEFIDDDFNLFSVRILTSEQYEVLLNGISLYFDQWIAEIGIDALAEMKRRLLERKSLSGLVLNGYRVTDRMVALSNNMLTSMDDDGDCE